MGIDQKRRPDGSIVVVRSVLDAAPSVGRNRKRTEPNWEAHNHRQDEACLCSGDAHDPAA
jgi:hypothetical protein